MFVVKRLLIVILSMTLPSCATFTSWNLSFETSHVAKGNNLTIYVQKRLSEVSKTGHIHGGTAYDVIYHKVAKITINLTNDVISKSTVIENNDVRSANHYYFMNTLMTEDRFEHYCGEIVDKQGRNDCFLEKSQQYNDRIFFSIKLHDGVDSIYTLTETNGAEFVELCRFSGQDIQQQLALKLRGEVVYDADAVYNWHGLFFQLLPDGKTYQAVLHSKEKGLNNYYILTLNGCFNIVDFVALDPKNKFLKGMELDRLKILEKRLYLSYLGFDSKSLRDPNGRPKLLLIDTDTKKITEITQRRRHYVYDQSTRTILFYEIDLDSQLLSEHQHGSPSLFLDMYSIDTGQWEEREYDVEFSYDKI